VDGFTYRRLLELIGNIPPAEAEDRYYAMLEQLNMAAWLKPNSLRQTRDGSVRYRPFFLINLARCFSKKLGCGRSATLVGRYNSAPCWPYTA
jgi:hypothetical protein